MGGFSHRPGAEGDGRTDVRCAAMPPTGGPAGWPANSLAVAAIGARQRWHQIQADRGSGWLVTGTQIAPGRLLLGVVRQHQPLGEYLPVSLAQAERMAADLAEAFRADAEESGGSAEFLIVAGIPFDRGEADALLEVIAGLLAGIAGHVGEPEMGQ